ncbi:hypothetical protein SAMN02745165_01188 [Malonomonas rubra DSM 5091]|uniref:Sporulation and spore germination n=1 Tax=Malonomonas rubra DSM 5091 TaxID=1122189 RepID=A0A1M6F8C2_MALRU|nr:GerMN domain-containing protein [Malonomonas rubra]SHI93923.1 hypothetical protein SAMN02745165_01188 [Malonomonas rubra DSM 5091]
MRCQIVLFLFVITLLFGCEQQQATAPDRGKVYASPAYLQYFGEAPAPQQGYVFAHVGYLPLADDSAQVRPIPLFMFSENQQLDRILSQLFSERLLVAEQSKLRMPFAEGVRLTQLDQAGSTLIVSLELTRDVPSHLLAGIERATVESAVQFEEVDRVRILYSGEPSERQPVEGYRHQPLAITDVQLPLLLDAVGSWQPGEKEVEEVFFNFDRPVKVERFELKGEAGNPLEGDYYLGMFDMAVVLRPQQAELFQPGMTLHVDWQVEDRKGRKSKASSKLNLIGSQQ